MISLAGKRKDPAMRLISTVIVVFRSVDREKLTIFAELIIPTIRPERNIARVDVGWIK